MPDAHPSVMPSLLRGGGGDRKAGRLRRAARSGDNRTPWQRVTISGGLGDDAKPYQEREVRRKIEESQE